MVAHLPSPHPDTTTALRRARELDGLVAEQLRQSPAAAAVLAKPRRGKNLDRQRVLEQALAAAQAARQKTGSAAALLAEAQQLRWGAATAAQRIAVRQAKKCKHGTWAEADLVQFGLIGLYEAAKRYDPDAGVAFGTYGTWWARAQITRSAADPGLSAYSHERLRLLRKLEAQGGPVSDAEAAQWLRITEEGVAELRELRELLHPVSLNAPAREDGDPLIDQVPDPDSEEYDDTHARLLSLLQQLPAQDQRILTRRFGLDGKPHATLYALGETLGVSSKRARQLQQQALRRLRDLWEAPLSPTPARPAPDPLEDDPTPERGLPAPTAVVRIHTGAAPPPRITLQSRLQALLAQKPGQTADELLRHFSGRRNCRSLESTLYQLRKKELVDLSRLDGSARWYPAGLAPTELPEPAPIAPVVEAEPHAVEPAPVPVVGEVEAEVAPAPIVSLRASGVAPEAIHELLDLARVPHHPDPLIRLALLVGAAGARSSHAS